MFDNNILFGTIWYLPHNYSKIMWYLLHNSKINVENKPILKYSKLIKVFEYIFKFISTQIPITI